MPLFLCADVLLSYLLVNLWDIHFLKFFMHLVEKEAKEVASVLLLIVWVVDKQERFKNALRVDNSLTEEPFGVELVSLVKVFAHVDKLSQKAVLFKALFNFLVRGDSLKQVEKSWACEQ